jgi:putative phosphoribosyl transferase
MGRHGYANRDAAGRELAPLVAAELAEAADADSVIVLGLARGGVPVAAPIAAALGAQLDALVVRKIGAPGHEELAIGAMASGGAQVLNRDLIAHLALRPEMVERQIARAHQELTDREQRLRGGRAFPALEGRVVILVDDGLATGATMKAAARAVAAAKPRRVVVAVPVGAPDTCAEVAELVDELICPLRPRSFHAVGEWYDDFHATTDRDVATVLGH